jgi:hypothetical protein
MITEQTITSDPVVLDPPARTTRALITVTGAGIMRLSDAGNNGEGHALVDGTSVNLETNEEIVGFSFKKTGAAASAFVTYYHG